MTAGWVESLAPQRDGENAVSALRALVGRELGRTGLSVVSVPAPLVPSEVLLAATKDEDAVLYANPNGFETVGLDAAVTITASGAERFAAVRRSGQALLAELSAVGPAPEPRLLGGFAFQPGSARTPPWRAFGEARFVLPRVGYLRRDGRAFLYATLGQKREPGLDELLERIGRALGTTGAEPFKPSAAPRSASLVDRGEADFVARVEAARTRIESEDLEKVVVARRIVIELDPAPDAARVLMRLRADAVGCTRFAMRRERAVFLGATPERLVALRGHVVETEAVAGSIRAGDPQRAQELIESQKDRSEHELVVRELVSALEPLSRLVVHGRVPEVRVLRHVLHLWTPIRAELAESRHVLELLERLHPTPAVGGVPTLDAVRWIAEHEPDERGWYAGPFGWFDRNGDGEFIVALRSGVLERCRAHLYAGAGIVRASSARAELAETRLKLLALLAALGLEAPFGAETSR